MAAIVKRGAGFIYYISREGVTGMQSQVASNLAEQVAKIRAHTTLPIGYCRYAGKCFVTA